MATHFPMTFTLESGTHVQVTKRNDETYEFVLTPQEGSVQTFTYREGQHTKAEWDERLTFEPLDALREFWVKTEAIL